jgi:hypothetical protein
MLLFGVLMDDLDWLSGVTIRVKWLMDNFVMLMRIDFVTGEFLMARLSRTIFP